MPPEPAALLDGTPYRFVGVRAQGGMGIVLDAERDGRAVVVKLLRPDRVEVKSLGERLLAEARVLQRLSHPNLVAVLDSGLTPDGQPYLVMERLEGRSLKAELAARGALPVADALEVCQQALAGLGAAHQSDVVHRDVKPSNLFVCGELGPEMHVKLIDFGIAKLSPQGALASIAPPPTLPGEALGSPWFMAPEQIMERPVTPATDVYALGMVLYQMLVGRHPFANERDAPHLFQAHISVMPTAPSRLAKQALPPHLDHVVLRALAKLPADRYASAADFARALRDESAVAGSRQAETVASDRELGPAMVTAITAVTTRAATTDTLPAAPPPPLHTLASATNAFAPPVAAPRIEVMTAATAVPAAAPIAVTLRSLPSLPRLPPPRPARTRLGTTSFAAGALGIAWHGFGAVSALGTLTAEKPTVAAPPEVIARLGIAEIGSHLLFGGCAVALVLLAGSRDPTLPARRGPAWVAAMLTTSCAGLAVDLALFADRAKFGAAASPALAPYATPLAVAGALVTFAVHVAVVLVVRAWLREHAAPPAGHGTNRP
jgi:eukaryotic-like serine/threonine-protein kinase